MQTFQIVRQTGGGKRRINGRAVDTMQATVRFPDGITTRHLEHHPVLDEKGKIIGHQWTGWNSDSVRRERTGILESHVANQESVRWATSRVQKLTDELGELKGKRDVEAREKRAELKAALKDAKAYLNIAKGDLEHVATIAKRVDETHPEIVEFV